jgi:hypothetical protein
MFMHLQVCVYVYIYTYIHTYIFMYIRIYLLMHLQVYASVLWANGEGGGQGKPGAEERKAHRLSNS